MQVFPYVQPREVSLSDQKLRWLSDEINSWVDSGELVGADLLVVKNGKAAFHEAFGWSNRENQRPMQRNSIFPVKSMSKPITATAVLMLADDGKLSLDDPVSAYVPNFPHSGVTIAHLLSHTSGIEYDFDSYNFLSPDATLDNVVEDWPHSKSVPGLGQFSYNDYNYAALAYIVGVVSERPPHEFIRDRIFVPLGMSKSSALFLADKVWQGQLNPSYIWNSERKMLEFRRPNTQWPNFYAGGWGVFSTARDYAAFLAMWMAGGVYGDLRMLSERAVNAALNPRAEIGENLYYGFGWHLERTSSGGMHSFFHGGGGELIGMAIPSDEVLVIYLTQSRLASHYAAFQNRLFLSGLVNHPGLGFRFQSLQWAEDDDLPNQKLPATSRARYIGTYRPENEASAENLVFTIQESGEHLHFRWGAPGSKADNILHLVTQGNHKFAFGRFDGGRLMAVDRTYSLRFIRAGDKPLTLEILAPDDVLYRAHKIE